MKIGDEPLQMESEVAGVSEAHDPVTRPSHYHFGEIEPIVAIEAWSLGFNLGNTVKYIARAEHKGVPLQDLKKARWYLDREIQRREKQQPEITQ